jgi:hypothetical protein
VTKTSSSAITRISNRQHSKAIASGDDIVVHLDALGVVDDVDEHVAVPCLVEPLLRWVLRAHAGADQRLERALGVLRLDHEVEVVRGLRPSARPAGQAAAEEERHAGIAQGLRGLLERRLDLGEIRRGAVRHLLDGYPA